MLSFLIGKFYQVEIKCEVIDIMPHMHVILFLEIFRDNIYMQSIRWNKTLLYSFGWIKKIALILLKEKSSAKISRKESPHTSPKIINVPSIS